MAFIRCRKSNKANSYQLIESYREDGKVKQRVIANLGRCSTIEEALPAVRRDIEMCNRILARRARGGPPRGGYGSRYRRGLEKKKRWAEARLAKSTDTLERLEAVVSESVRRHDIVDTTPLALARRSVVRLANGQLSRLTNRASYSLSGLQAAILKTMYTKRVPGARGADSSHAELLAEIWGWEPKLWLRWPADHAAQFPKDYYRAGDTIPSTGGHYGMFPDVPIVKYRSGQASLSRALSRLNKRGLVDFVGGTIGTYGGGPALTSKGELVARLVTYPNVEEVIAAE